MLSPELQFILQCVRVDTCENRHAQLLSLLPSLGDWASVLNLAHHHGVVPLLYTRLKETAWDSLPKDAQEAFDFAHRVNATHALSLTGELLRLSNLLQAHNIFALPYKGPALAVQLYGDVAMRQYGDLDVVIAKEDWAIVDALLCQDEWQPQYRLPAAQEPLYQEAYKDHSYVSARQGHLLEIHWGFADPHMSFPFTLRNIKSRLLVMPLSGLNITVPAPEDLLVLLCFHGAKHKWERLGWIADITQLLVISLALDWSLVNSMARELRCERVMNLSLELARRLCNAPLPESVQQQIRQDTSALALAREIEAELLAEKVSETAMMELIFFHLKMRESWLDRLLYMFRLIFRTTPEDWSMLPVVLPTGLALLYYPARLVRLTRKYLLRSAG